MNLLADLGTVNLNPPTGFENLENIDDFSEFIEEIMKFIKKK